jgi:hypothetical protein
VNGPPDTGEVSAVRWKEGEYWLRDAVKYVEFPPDRRRVQEELYEHMISRNLDFLARGASEEEADRLVCEAMGDPEEVGKALAEVHKPFWGYFLRVLRIVMALVLLLCAFQMFLYHGGNSLRYYRSERQLYEAHMEGWIGQSSAEKCGDYRFRLRRAGVAGPREEPWPQARHMDEDSPLLVFGDEEEIHQFIPPGSHLVLELRASTWDPLLGNPELDSRGFTVQDSLGNRCGAYVYAVHDWGFFSEMMILTRDFDPAAEWAVLTYDSGDRSFRLPVRLKGEGT